MGYLCTPEKSQACRIVEFRSGQEVVESLVQTSSLVCLGVFLLNIDCSFVIGFMFTYLLELFVDMHDE